MLQIFLYTDFGSEILGRVSNLHKYLILFQDVILLSLW